VPRGRNGAHPLELNLRGVGSLFSNEPLKQAGNSLKLAAQGNHTNISGKKKGILGDRKLAQQNQKEGKVGCFGPGNPLAVEKGWSNGGIKATDCESMRKQCHLKKRRNRGSHSAGGGFKKRIENELAVLFRKKEIPLTIREILKWASKIPVLKPQWEERRPLLGQFRHDSSGNY